MIQPLEEWLTKAKEAPSPHEVRLNLLDTNPVFQCLGEKFRNIARILQEYSKNMEHENRKNIARI